VILILCYPLVVQQAAIALVNCSDSKEEQYRGKVDVFFFSPLINWYALCCKMDGQSRPK